MEKIIILLVSLHLVIMSYTHVRTIWCFTSSLMSCLVTLNHTSSAAEIAMFENNIVVYKFVQDLHFFVTGGEDENELILATVLQGFFDAVGLLLR